MFSFQDGYRRQGALVTERLLQDSRFELLRSRRAFLVGGTAIAASTLIGCRDVDRPAASLGAFGFSIDFASDGTFSLNADPRKVFVCGMCLAGVISPPTALGAMALLTLIDAASSEHFVLALASTAVVGQIGRKINPWIDFEVDISQFIGTDARVDLEAEDDGSSLAIGGGSSISAIDDLRGTWQAAAPDGRMVQFEFFRPIGASKIQYDSASFAEPCTFEVDSVYAMSAGGVAATVFEGRTFGVYAADGRRKVRSAPLRFVCWDDRVINAETQYHRVDGRGVQRSSFWPFAMSRI